MSFRLKIVSILLGIVASVAGANVSLAGTVGYWRFEEGVAGEHPPEDSGSNVGFPDSIIDSSGTGNHGTAYQVATDLTYSASVPGQVVNPGALVNSLSMSYPGDHAGSVERIEVADNATLDANISAGITFEAFVNPNSTEGHNPIIGKWSAGGGTSYIFRLEDVGSELKLRMFLSGASTSSVTSETTIPLNQWTHVAGTWDDSDDTMRLYVNGVQDANTELFDSAVNDSTSEFWIGAGDGGTDFAFAGSIDEVRFSDTALMPSEFLSAEVHTSLVVNRNTGAMTLSHNIGASGAIDIQGYSITSASGALLYDNWKPIAGNYDAAVGADQSVDDTNEWTILTNPSSHEDLSEFEFGGTGGLISPGEDVVLSEAAGAWIATPTEDLFMTIVLSDGETIEVPVVYEGNSGASFDRSDLNRDGSVDEVDWPLYRDNLFVDLSGMSLAEAYLLGDLDQDGDNDFDDLTLFKEDFDNALGEGAFAAMAESVPEPSSLTLLALSTLALFTRRFRRSLQSKKNALLMAVAVVLCFSVAGETVQASTVGYWRFEEGVPGQNPPEDGSSNTGFADAIIDSSGTDNHGTAVQINDLTYSTSVPGNPVNPGALTNLLSMDFKGDSGVSVERIIVADDDSLDNGLTGITLEAFVNPESHIERNTILNKWTGSGGTSYIFRLNTTGQIEFFISGGANKVTSALSVPTGEWSHVAATWDDADDTMRVFVNGVEDVNTLSITGGINNSTSDLWIGASDGGTDFAFVGALDEVRVSNTALSPIDFLMAVPSDPVGLTALIHPGSGQVVLKNESLLTIDMNGYHLTSDSTALDEDAWLSLDEQDYDSIGAGVGESWDEVGSSNPSSLAEAFLSGSSVLDPGEAVSIGAAYNPAMSSAGIALTYRDVITGDTVDGFVEVVLLGDMDGNGIVDDADVNPFVQALTNRSDFDLAHADVYADLVGDFNENGRLDLGDISGFKAAVGASGAGSATSVPEPTTFGMFLVSLLLFAAPTRKSNRRVAK